MLDGMMLHELHNGTMIEYEAHHAHETHIVRAMLISKFEDYGHDRSLRANLAGGNTVYFDYTATVEWNEQTMAYRVTNPSGLDK